MQILSYITEIVQHYIWHAMSLNKLFSLPQRDFKKNYARVIIKYVFLA